MVWSRTFERVQPADAEGVDRGLIVISLTNSLLQSYGVIRARDRANSTGVECRRSSLSLHPGSGRRDPHVRPADPRTGPRLPRAFDRVDPALRSVSRFWR